MTSQYTESELGDLREMARGAVVALATLTDEAQIKVLRGIVLLPIIEAEEASRLLAAKQRAAEAQLELFKAFELPAA